MDFLSPYSSRESRVAFLQHTWSTRLQVVSVERRSLVFLFSLFATLHLARGSGSHGLVERSRDDLSLVLQAQPVEIDGVAADAHGEVRVLGRIVHGVHERGARHDVDVEMLPPPREVPRQQRAQIRRPALFRLPQTRRRYGEGVGHPVQARLVRNFRHRVERGERPFIVSPVHRVRPRRKRRPRGSPVRRPPRVFPVHHVTGDGQHAQRRGRAPVHRRAFHQLVAKRTNDVDGDGVDAIVVDAVRGPVALDVERDGESRAGVAHGHHRGVFDGAETVHQHAQARDAERHEPSRVRVHERVYRGFVVMEVVGIVYGVHRVRVEAGEPRGVGVEPAPNVVVSERGKTNRLSLGVFEEDETLAGERDGVAAERTAQRRVHRLGRDPRAGDLVHAAVERVQQQLRKVTPRAEKLRVSAKTKTAHAAADAVIAAAKRATHQRVVLVLDRTRPHGDGGCESAERSGERVVPQHGHVRLGRGAEVDERLQETPRRRGDEMRGRVVFRLASERAPADATRGPHGIAGEDLVVRFGSELPHEPELDDEVVDEFLRLRLGSKRAGSKVAFDEDVEEGVEAAEGDGGAVVGFDGGEVREVGPSRRLGRRRGGTGDVAVVPGRHAREVLERADLKGELLAELKAGLVRGVGSREREAFGAFSRRERVDAVERDAAVVAEVASAAVGVREAGDDVVLSRGAHLGGVQVEDAVVVGASRAAFAVRAEDIGGNLEVLLRARLGQEANPSEGFDAPDQRRLRLEPGDDVVELGVDPRGGVGGDGARARRVHAEAPPGAELRREQRLALGPERHRLGRGAAQRAREVVVARRDVREDEGRDVQLGKRGVVRAGRLARRGRDGGASVHDDARVRVSGTARRETTTWKKTTSPPSRPSARPRFARARTPVVHFSE